MVGIRVPILESYPAIHSKIKRKPYTLNPNLEVDGRNFESLFSNPTCDPTQRLRGNPITLNLQALIGTSTYIS